MQNHYDECTAKDAVPVERLSFEQAVETFMQNVEVLSDEDTIWDVYVATNVWAALFDGKTRDAITFFFNDPRTPSCKVWAYMHSV